MKQVKHGLFYLRDRPLTPQELRQDGIELLGEEYVLNLEKELGRRLDDSNGIEHEDVVDFYTYNISPNINKEAFYNTCKLIEENVKDIIEAEYGEDVDGTQIKLYSTEYGQIVIFNDYEVGAVYIESQIPLKFLADKNK